MPGTVILVKSPSLGPRVEAAIAVLLNAHAVKLSSEHLCSYP